ncbi:hypothetical protein PIB30_076651 [Stylosanthes scabra]|uniref:DUF4283 domain-containing protein n=1 Tax=Stylosanthes scabra TaxID=79078 RepID=A0ABU6WT39_9FABA|nr:hypothetical protein [Stylosanthes scabra]
MKDENSMCDMESSKVLLQMVEEEREKMVRSLVGEIVNPMNFEEVKKAIMMDWHTLVGVRSMGTKMVVLTFDSVENMEEALRSPFLLNHLIDIRRWSGGKTNLKRKI